MGSLWVDHEIYRIMIKCNAERLVSIWALRKIDVLLVSLAESMALNIDEGGKKNVWRSAFHESFKLIAEFLSKIKVSLWSH